ncbi:hypothetical protein C464_01356 [Halorubrum coriense DSM 10284]|uniref:Uncharacterized protein n=1 Tax=Halorubrum coriense DSM 10284 TaxID=1227466 RepID=M0EW49_9EURY|nr:hypothetical protein C464_01356 [Halorubrum coriense DSM 10284]
MDRLRERDPYERLLNSAAERGFLSGKDYHGTVHKVLEPGGAGGSACGDADGPEHGLPPVPTLVSSGEPPKSGVCEPQAVRAVGIAKRWLGSTSGRSSAPSSSTPRSASSARSG